MTICTFDHGHLFGEIVKGVMKENAYGVIVRDTWNRLPLHYQRVLLDAFAVMPNHLHAIIGIADEAVAAGLRPATTTKRYPLSEIVRALKSFSARRINELRGAPGTPVWQANYYDRIIRDEKSLQQIRDYILTNPQHWESDERDPTGNRIDNLGWLS